MSVQLSQFVPPSSSLPVSSQFSMSGSLFLPCKRLISTIFLDSIYMCFCYSVTKSCPAAAAAKSLQSCPTLCDPIDGRPPGSSVPGILHARILEWVAISFSNAWKWKVKVKLLSHVWLLTIPWTAAYQEVGRRSMGFSRQEYWSRVPLLTPKPQSIPPLPSKSFAILNRAVINILVQENKSLGSF